MIRNPLTWLNTMVTEPHYLFHYLLFFSYLSIRVSAASVLSPFIHHRLLYREIQAVLAFSVFASVKMVREETWEAFIADTLLYAKGLLLVFALFVDYHLALWYMVAFLVVFLGHAVIYILTQQPAFQVLGGCIPLTPLQLETSLTEGDTSRFWLVTVTPENVSLQSIRALKTSQVEFRALSLASCARTSQIFPELSITYSNKNLSFGVVDLGLFPNSADKFGISLQGSAALPTYILFDKNVEVARYPEADFEMKASHPPITKKALCQHFELDLRLIEYVGLMTGEEKVYLAFWQKKSDKPLSGEVLVLLSICVVY
ncbi:hypothetical protein V2J09_022784 [Rumex salicifolius]